MRKIQNISFYSDCAVTSPASKGLDDEYAKKLWEASIDLVGLKEYNPFSADDPGVQSK